MKRRVVLLCTAAILAFAIIAALKSENGTEGTQLSTEQPQKSGTLQAVTETESNNAPQVEVKQESDAVTSSVESNRLPRIEEYPGLSEVFGQGGFPPLALSTNTPTMTVEFLAHGVRSTNHPWGYTDLGDSFRFYYFQGTNNPRDVRKEWIVNIDTNLRVNL